MFQKSNGGFSTYLDEILLLSSLNDKNISDVSGWLSAHNCVSAVSLYFLVNFCPNGQSVMKLKQYFDADYENKLKPYWWTSSIYMYYYLAKTYQIIGDGRKLNSIISSIKEMQNENGSFSDTYGESFFTQDLH
jgi:hypothetical protein